MHILSGTLQGRKHAENEDHLFIRKLIDWDAIVFGVADGIGSHPFGGSVAKWISNNMKLAPLSLDGTFRNSINTFLKSTHQNFVREFSDFDEFLNSGCTISLVAIHRNEAFCFWAGDSPIFYTCPNSKISKRITTPHINHLGSLTEYFGGNRELNLECVKTTLEPNDLITIVSDGVIVDEFTILDAAVSGKIYSGFLDDTLETSVKPLNSDDSTIICYQH